MSPERACPDCGAPLHADAPRGLCPACLMGAALEQPTPAPTATFEPVGSLAALAETVGTLPRVLLRDTDGASGVDPVIQPASDEMPDLSDRSAHLQLFGEIARGGMGAVLKGRDVDLGRDLAVKVLLEKHRHHPALVRRFVEEAQIAGQLQHPGVVPIYELGAFADRRPYFAMKLVKGRTLAAILADRADPAEGTMGLLTMLLQVGQAVAYAHARGVIHRDLKPSNVMVGSFGEVQVMDWGLAKVLPRGGATDDAAAGRPADHETVIATARSGSGSDLSQAGSVMGTPAYMAPEQARGEVETIDERADVFAIGSMLCEILTGRPAYVGRSAGEIQRKAARGDLADALGRLEAVGADVELVALAKDCLAVERDDRPRDASSFVNRLGEYRASIEQRLRAAELERAAESARAEEAQARVAVERSRRRRTVALAASLLAMTTLGGLTFTSLLQQRQARIASADRVLGEVTTLLAQARGRPEDMARWQAAQAAVRQVDPDSLPTVARARLVGLSKAVAAGAAAARADQELLARLIDVRSAEADDPDGSATDAAYADAFGAAGIDVDALGPEATGAKIRSRPESVALGMAAALDDWASKRRQSRPRDTAAWRRLVTTARVADPDPRRGEVRALCEQPDRKAQLEPLLSLAGRVDVESWPVPTQLILAAALDEAGDVDAAAALLRRTVGRHAGDVWANYNLARFLERAHPPRRDEAIRYDTVARAVRPETAHGLAHLLEQRGETDDAIVVFRDLNRLRPNESRHLSCLGRALKSRGRSAEAAAVFEAGIALAREAIRLRPDDVNAHSYLGLALASQGKLGEAVVAFREAIRLKPDYAEAHYNLAVALGNQGELNEVVAAYREAIRLKPDYAEAHCNLGLALGNQGKLGEAVVAYREAIRLKPDLAEAHCNLGLLLRSRGQYAEALAELRTGHELGSKRPVWRSPSAAWVRQAEVMVALAERLPAIVAGDDRPKDVAEGLTVARMCFDTKRHAAAARLWAEALDSDPRLADDRMAQHRYNAACAAALAGAGKGEDDPPPDDAARLKLREQALGWLRAELVAWEQVASTVGPGNKEAVAKALAHWKQDADLTSVRDADGLASLPEPEREAWRALWDEVDRLLARASAKP